MFVTDEDSFAGSAHAVLVIVFFEALEACEDGGVFFWLRFFGAEGVIGEGEEADCFGLVAVEGFGELWGIRGLQGGGGDCRHRGWC